MPDDKLKILYDAGSEQFNLGTFDEFTVKMQDEDKRKTLYDNLSEQYNLGTFEEYNTKISSSLGVTPSKPQVTPLVTPEVTPAIEEPVQKGYKFTKFGQIVPLMEGDDPDTVGGAFDRFTTNFVRELSLGRAGTKRVLDPAETTGEVVADVAGTLAGLAIPLAIPIGGTEYALTRLTTKIPRLVKVFRLGIKSPKVSKAAERLTRGAISNTIGFNIHGQAYKHPTDTTIEDRVDELLPTTMTALMFSGAGALGQLGKMGKILSYPAVGAIGYNMTPDDPNDPFNDTRKVVGGLALMLLHGTFGNRTTKLNPKQKADVKSYIDTALKDVDPKIRESVRIKSLETLNQFKLKNKELFEGKIKEPTEEIPKPVAKVAEPKVEEIFETIKPEPTGTKKELSKRVEALEETREANTRALENKNLTETQREQLTQSLERIDELKNETEAELSFGLEILPGLREKLRRRKDPTREEFKKLYGIDLTRAEIDKLYQEAKTGEAPLLKEAMPTTVKGQKLQNVWLGTMRVWEPLLGLPDKKLFLKERNKFLGQQTNLKNVIQDMVKTFQKFSEDDRHNVVKVLTGDAEMNVLPKDLQPIVKKVRKHFDASGQSLVRRGLLSQEAYDNWKGRYITNVYMRHLLDEGPGMGGRVKMSLEYKKQRKVLSEETKAELGKIETPELPIQIGLTREWGDVFKYDYMQNILKNDKWVYQDALVDVNGVKVGVGYAEGVLDVYRKMLPHVEESQKEIVTNKIGVLEESIAKAREESGKVVGDFERVPNSPGYGPLKGIYLRKPIADDIIAMFEITDPSEYRSLTKQVINLERKITAIWKAAKVPFNPPTIMRNIVSNPVQLNLSGMPYQDIVARMGEAALKMKNKHPDLKMAQRQGVFGGTWGEAEIDLILRETKTLKLGFKTKRMDALYEFFGKIGHMYGKIDEFYKFTKYLDGRKKGLDPATATLEAHKWVMDYTLLDPKVRVLREHILGMPFITYQNKILPLAIEAARKRPWVYAKYLAIPAAITAYTLSKQDISEQEWENLQMTLPEYLKEGNYMVVPMRDEKGRLQLVNLEYFLPWGNWLEVQKNIRSGEMGEAIGNLGQNPMLLAMSALTTGLNPSTKGKIYNALEDNPTDRAKAYFEYFYDQALPGWMATYGAGAKTLEAVGLKDQSVYDVNLTPGQAALRWLGVNVTPIDPWRSGTKQSSIFHARKIQLDKSYRKQLKKLTTPKGLDEKKYQALNEKYQKQLMKLWEETIAPTKTIQEGIRKEVSSLINIPKD